MNLKDLVEKEKPYYGSGQHYFNYENFKVFYEEMKGYDVDMNLVYRFDIKYNEDEDIYYLMVYTILQRKGTVTEHQIENFKDEDIKLLKKYLEPHKKVCKQLLDF